MSRFKVVSIQHQYASTAIEHRIVAAAGGDYVDTDALPLAEALRAAEDADAILVRWLRIGPELIRRFAPSGVRAMFQGRLPTSTVPTTVLLPVSMTLTVPSLPLETKTRLPSGLAATPAGFWLCSTS